MGDRGTSRASERATTGPPDPDQRVYLHNVTWEDYERIDALRQDSSVPRLTYDGGRARADVARPEPHLARSQLLPDREAIQFWSRKRGLEIVLGDEAWQRAERSSFVPAIDPALLVRCMSEPSQTAAVQALRAALAG